MYITIGPASLAGVVVIVVLVPINGVLLLKYVRSRQVNHQWSNYAKWLGNFSRSMFHVTFVFSFQHKQMKEKDKRVVSTNEILSGMKVRDHKLEVLLCRCVLTSLSCALDVPAVGHLSLAPCFRSTKDKSDFRFWSCMPGSLRFKTVSPKSEKENLFTSGISTSSMLSPTFPGFSCHFWQVNDSNGQFFSFISALLKLAHVLCMYVWHHHLFFIFQVSLAIFSTYVMISEDHYLSPDKAFVTMSYINIFNFLLSILPLGVFFAGQVN